MQNAKGLALVTGASSGIGRAIALRLAKDGFHTLVHFNKNEAGAIETVAAIQREGGSADPIGFDVSDCTAIETALDTYMKTHFESGARIDVLINNAGIHNDTLLGIMSDEQFDSVLKTNVYGPFFLMRWTIRRMIRQRSGVIVNIASVAGQTGNAGQVNYAASKAALIAMTRSLSMEVGGRGIRVNAVAPGLIETQMASDMALDEYKKRIPLGRFGTPNEIAGAVSFLCSADATYITGSTISVNGGLFPS
jgi:3-oxoacyl-[acyl-carrier protein] reductase